MRSNSCDIFCKVVDNYGDIGVSWRLAKQLANEQNLNVRLWVDDLRSFSRLCPELDVKVGKQHCRGVEVWHWSVDFPAVEPADLVIETFACYLPLSYVDAMVAQAHKPVWINLEYLSAEDWVEGCHKLASPHSTLSLTKYFFFPGFTEKTGGLLLECDLLARRDAFQSDLKTQQNYWHKLGVPPRIANEVRISLFGYENAAMEALLSSWELGEYPITCLLPEGRSLPQIATYFGQQDGKVGDVWQRGKLRVHVLPFVEQEHYDLLLWACDVNFVRGEDSCVRAQWAGKPFIWQIYPQHDGVHLKKLEALRTRYTASLSPVIAQVLHDLWQAWNGGQDMGKAWTDFLAQREVLARHGPEWALQLAPNSLALNLLDFYRQVA